MATITVTVNTTNGALLDGDDDPFFLVRTAEDEELVTSPTEVVIENTFEGKEVVLQGSGIAFGLDGEPISGTITTILVRGIGGSPLIATVAIEGGVSLIAAVRKAQPV